MNISGIIAKLKLSKILKNKLVVRLVVCLLAVVALGIFASTFINKKSTKTSSQVSSTSTTYSSSVLAYSRAIASQIEDMLAGVKGLNNVKVVVVAESSPEIKYLKSGEGNESIILEKQSSITKPVIVTELTPRINGILIVADGATNLLLKNKVISALSAVYSVDSAKIDILEGK